MSEPLEQFQEAQEALGPKSVTTDGTSVTGRDFKEYKDYIEWAEGRRRRSKIVFSKYRPPGMQE